MLACETHHLPAHLLSLGKRVTHNPREKNGLLISSLGRSLPDRLLVDGLLFFVQVANQCTAFNVEEKNAHILDLPLDALEQILLCAGVNAAPYSVCYAMQQAAA